MSTMELLQGVLDYIEENLTTEIEVDELAKMAKFSEYHFYHLFSDIVGMPVATYITKRRIQHAIYTISQSDRMVDVILAYGFETHAGFYKAFKSEFGCSPSKFLKLTMAQKPRAVNLLEEAKIMLTNTQIKEMLTNWELEGTLKIDPTFTAGGAMKAPSTWQIGNQYVFKTGGDIAGVRAQIAIAKALAQNGMDASCPIPTKKGEEIVIRDGRFYMVTNKIQGDFLPPQERYGENRDKIAVKYGSAIGKLHEALLEVEDLVEANDTNMLDMVMNWAMPHTKTVLEQWGCALPEAFYLEYVENFPKIYEKLPRQMIHRDANPSNIMFDGGDVTGFIDFALSERNIRLFDPCYCATGILSEACDIEDGFDKWPDILKGIVKGYNEIVHLENEEIQAIPYVIYSIQMIFIAWLIDNEKYKNCALQNRKMLVWMWENKERCFQ
ncbi:MAG: helix-turn-helix domain-containing protein [Cellulosilyticaceae bacterium]